MTDEKRAARLDGAELIAAERRRQIEAEGYDAQHDAEVGSDELAAAGIAYAINAHFGWAAAKGWWPWSMEAWKPTDPTRDMVKAGALFAASIDAEADR